jgi:hypothetical protein
MSHLAYGDQGPTVGFGGSQQQGSQAPAPSAPLAPISFADFLQLIDMQFLDHIRRGTSINMVDLSAPPPPSTLEECLMQVGAATCNGLWQLLDASAARTMCSTAGIRVL